MVSQASVEPLLFSTLTSVAAGSIVPSLRSAVCLSIADAAQRMGILTGPESEATASPGELKLVQLVVRYLRHRAALRLALLREAAWEDSFVVHLTQPTSPRETDAPADEAQPEAPAGHRRFISTEKKAGGLVNGSSGLGSPLLAGTPPQTPTLTCTLEHMRSRRGSMDSTASTISLATAISVGSDATWSTTDTDMTGRKKTKNKELVKLARKTFFSLVVVVARMELLQALEEWRALAQASRPYHRAARVLQGGARAMHARSQISLKTEPAPAEVPLAQPSRSPGGEP